MTVAAVVFDLYGTLLAIDSMQTHVAAARVRDPGAFGDLARIAAA